MFGDPSRLGGGRIRSATAENPTGAPGAGGLATEGTGAAAARDLGPGWKVSPSVRVPAGGTHVLADATGPGTVRHIWLTLTGGWRNAVLVITYDDDDHPAVEVPVGDFFGLPWGRFHQISSLPVTVNPRGGFNSWWPMPFRHRIRVALRNDGHTERTVYHQVTWEEGPVPDDAGYLCALWRRTDPVTDGVHVILPRIEGGGSYVGTVLGWGPAEGGWWGEGEVRFRIDDEEPGVSICGTGTEDYVGGAWCFLVDDDYRPFTTPHAGFLVDRPAGPLDQRMRVSMHRWHLADPIRFSRSLAVDIQVLGWRAGGRYHRRRDDVCSVALWYHRPPVPVLEPLADPDAREII